MPPSPSVFRLTASTIAAYFKHRCDRLFRWTAVHTDDRGKPGVGWNVPRRQREHSRPGIAMLMAAGNEFEISHIEAFIADVGETDFVWADITRNRGQTVVAPLPMSDFLAACRRASLPRYAAQIEIDAGPGSLYGASLLARFGLDPTGVTFGIAKPDMIEFQPIEGQPGRARLRIWDFKASQQARHDHFIQVAFYSFLLEEVLQIENLSHLEVDTEWAVIRSRQGDETFELAPYRLALQDFFLNRVPTLLNTSAADAHYHFHEKCALCDYAETCHEASERTFDLSRIPYLTSESKRRIKGMGITDHRQLAALDPDHDTAVFDQLREASHDLSAHLDRYIAAAQALEDGLPRALDAHTLQMPRYDDVRIVLSAEQDAVTGTCFAIGMKITTGEWDEANNRPHGEEHVFIAKQRDDEASLLLNFLRTLNGVLLRIDSENRAISSRPIDEEPVVQVASQALRDAEAAKATFRQQWPRITSKNPQAEALNAKSEAYTEAIKQAKKQLTQAKKDAKWEIQRQQQRLHFYIYDSLDLLVLKSALERHIFTAPPALLAEITTLVRLFPPESILPDAETFRTIPGTVVANVLRALVALPTPYQYDLRSVSERFPALKKDGTENGYVFRPRYGYGWEHSNQVAFERIHDVWNGKSFESKQRTHTPTEVLAEIEATVRAKLRATDSIVRRLKGEYGPRLRLIKEPFQLYSDFNPLSFQLVEALRVFTLIEAALAELQIKHRHTMPIKDRVATFECLSDLRLLSQESDGSMWFSFDPAGRDTKWEPGEYNLVLTPADRPEVLLGEIDGGLFRSPRWKYDSYKVKLLAFNLAADPPQVHLLPEKPSALRDKVDLGQPCVLDPVHADPNSPRVMKTLAALEQQPTNAAHIYEFLSKARSSSWQPFASNADQVEDELRRLVREAGGDDTQLLNPAQWHSWHGVMQTPLSLVWGPPGTGKTHTIAHMLLGYALAARMQQKPIRILVTAFTHHAINNVLKKVAALAERYGIGDDMLTVIKAYGSYHPDADATLPAQVQQRHETDVPTLISHEEGCTVIGATVWSTAKTMDNQDGQVFPWYDVILVDEASQLKVAEAVIAFCASTPQSTIILAGDDQQLPPIIYGTYPEEHNYLLTSIFAFIRHVARENGTISQVLYQLEENFRMNDPLTQYPNQVLYGGRFISRKPDICIQTDPPISAATGELIDLLLDPQRPVILCRYRPPQSFTARNPIEARLAALITTRLREVLISQDTGVLYEPRDFATEACAILSPHRAQNSTIRQWLVQEGFDAPGTEERIPMPIVDTVDKLQGQERDVIIVSYGVADEEYAEAEAAFLLSRNRFNVAATRARHKLIVLCSDPVLEVVPTDRAVLTDSMMLKEFRLYCADGSVTVDWDIPPYGTIPITVQWKNF